MVETVEPSEMGGGCQIGNLRLNRPTYHGEHLVKIGPVDPEISLLKGLFILN